MSYLGIYKIQINSQSSGALFETPIFQTDEAIEGTVSSAKFWLVPIRTWEALVRQSLIATRYQAEYGT